MPTRRRQIAAAVVLLAAGLLMALSAGAAASGLPTESASLKQTREVLPDRFVQYDSKRYVILSDASPSWTRTQLSLLERTHHQFLRMCRHLGLQPDPLQHKLVAVVFDDRGDYQRFARSHDSVSNPELSGYYSPRHDRVVFYNAESNPSVTKARSHLNELKSEMAVLKSRANEAKRMGLHEEAGSLHDMHGRYRDHIARQRDRVDHFSRQTTIATTVHEAVHQLMFHTGVQSARVQYPLWICEGLATAFETDDPDAAFGPGQEYEPRRSEFRSYLDGKQLLSLRNLIMLTSLEGLEEEHTAIVYQQSYAVITWMSRFRRDELRAYMQAMRAHEPGRPTPGEHLKLFTDAFGDVDKLERAWLRHELD